MAPHKLVRDNRWSIGTLKWGRNLSGRGFCIVHRCTSNQQHNHHPTHILANTSIRYFQSHTLQHSALARKYFCIHLHCKPSNWDNLLAFCIFELNLKNKWVSSNIMQTDLLNEFRWKATMVFTWKIFCKFWYRFFSRTINLPWQLGLWFDIEQTVFALHFVVRHRLIQRSPSQALLSGQCLSLRHAR